MIETELIQVGKKIKVKLDLREIFEGEVYKKYPTSFVLKTKKEKFCIIDEIQIKKVEEI